MISHLARLVAARESQTKGEWQTQTSTSVPEPNFFIQRIWADQAAATALCEFVFEPKTSPPRNDACPSVVGDESAPCPTAKTVPLTVLHKSMIIHLRDATVNDRNSQ